MISAQAILMLVVASSSAVEAWIAREVDGQGRLPALRVVLRESEVELRLADASPPDHWRSWARDRAWIPDLDARFGTDRSLDIRDATTTSWVRTGEGFGLQIRVRWSLADALFNDSVLRVDKTLRDRGAARWKARDRLVRLYFQRLELEMQWLERPTMEIALTAARYDSLLRAATGGRVAYGPRADNPWPRGQR